MYVFNHREDVFGMSRMTCIYYLYINVLYIYVNTSPRPTYHLCKSSRGTYTANQLGERTKWCQTLGPHTIGKACTSSKQT